MLLFAARLSNAIRRAQLLRHALVASVFFFVLAWQPLTDSLIRQFEDVHALPGGDLNRFYGVVVLGGAVNSAYVWHERHQVQLNEAADRMTEAVILARRYPNWRLVYIGTELGGKPDLTALKISGAPQAQQFFQDMGVPSVQLIMETQSSTTRQNALYGAVAVGDQIQQPWLLLTSAIHMPRALAVFRNVGWNVAPYPVDYQTTKKIKRLSRFSLVNGLRAWRSLFYESLGWLEYRWRGWI